ncbi:hypothetical protein Tco_0891778 [Tanacetum coccineum]|uniref:Uncharacterized protein n=1 Tax=Tanacetum coccineum TaxID=301880 RepID=A0ABQ5C780_9ASTR
MFHNLDQSRRQLERENLLEVNPRTCLEALRTQFKGFFASKRINSSEHLNQSVIHRAVITYGRLQLQSQDVQINPVQAVDDRLIVSKSSGIESENTNALRKSVNETQLQQHKSLGTESTTLEVNLNTDVKAFDPGSVIIESSRTKSDKHDTSSSSGTYITHAVNAKISDRVYEPKCSLLSKTIENADLKAQIQEKVFANVALKNELRKLKGNSMDTKFAKTIIWGNPCYNHLETKMVRQLTVFRSERPKVSKPRFSSQVDANNVLSKPVTPHYFSKVRESVFVKPNHVIASGSSRNSSKESYVSNDMAHNYYIEEAKKKTQDKNMNLKPSVMHTTSLQNTTNGSKPKPKSNNQTSRSLLVSKSSCRMSNGVPLVDHSRNFVSFSEFKHFVCSTYQKCVFNANHDDCIRKFLKEVNSRAKVQSLKTRNNNKPVEPKSHTQKPGRQIAIGRRIFKNAGLRWIPTGKMFIDSTTKVDSEPPNGSNDDKTNPYECDQTFNVSVGTLNLSTDNTLGPAPQRKEKCMFQCALSLKEEKSSCHSRKTNVITTKKIIPEQAQRDKDMQKKLALIAKYFKKIYKPTNNNLRTSSNSKNKNMDTTPRYKNDNQTGQIGNQRTVTVVGARKTVGSQETEKGERLNVSQGKMLLCKQAEKGVPLQAEQSIWYGYIKNQKKTVKNGQARTRESEEYKAEARKVKPQSKSAKKSQSQSKMVKLSQTQKDKSSKCFTLVPQLSQKSKNVPSSLIGPRKA